MKVENSEAVKKFDSENKPASFWWKLLKTRVKFKQGTDEEYIASTLRGRWMMMARMFCPALASKSIHEWTCDDYWFILGRAAVAGASGNKKVRSMANICPPHPSERTGKLFD